MESGRKDVSSVDNETALPLMFCETESVLLTRDLDMLSCCLIEMGAPLLHQSRRVLVILAVLPTLQLFGMALEFRYIGFKLI